MQDVVNFFCFQVQGGCFGLAHGIPRHSVFVLQLVANIRLKGMFIGYVIALNRANLIPFS